MDFIFLMQLHDSSFSRIQRGTSHHQFGACGKTMVASSSSPSPSGGAWEKRASARQDESCTFGSNLYGVTSYDPIDEENHYPHHGREDEGGDLFMF